MRDLSELPTSREMLELTDEPGEVQDDAELSSFDGQELESADLEAAGSTGESAELEHLDSTIASVEECSDIHPRVNA